MSYSRITIMTLGIALVALGACSPSRNLGKDAPSLAQYDYCVVSEGDSHGYFHEMMAALSTSFVVIGPNDPALLNPQNRRRACVAVADVSRGLWSVSGWIDLIDADTHRQIIRGKKRGGFFWSGARGDIVASAEDLALAREEAGPLPDRNRTDRERSSIVPHPQRASKEERLREIEELKAKGVITADEYTESRRKILSE